MRAESGSLDDDQIFRNVSLLGKSPLDRSYFLRDAFRGDDP